MARTVYLVVSDTLSLQILLAASSGHAAEDFIREQNRTLYSWYPAGAQVRVMTAPLYLAGHVRSSVVTYLVVWGEITRRDVTAFESSVDAHAACGAGSRVLALGVRVAGDLPVLPSASTAELAVGRAFEQEPHIAVTADTVLFALRDGVAHVLLIERDRDPFQGHFALPGGYVDLGEDLEAAARRELAEETGLTVERLAQVAAFGRPGRDPRGHVITIAYTAVLPTMPTPTAGDDARTAQWVPLREIGHLAFDHNQIVDAALRMVGTDLFTAETERPTR